MVMDVLNVHSWRFILLVRLLAETQLTKREMPKLPKRRNDETAEIAETAETVETIGTGFGAVSAQYVLIFDIVSASFSIIVRTS
jgi:hypothetical protein